MGLGVGSTVPDFTLPDQDGKETSFKSLLDSAEKGLVLFFYPKDQTTGCTAEACSFRDSYEDFCKLGATVVGISKGGPADHQEFRKKNNLPFMLLCDEQDKLRKPFVLAQLLKRDAHAPQVRKLFGVKSSLFGALPGRVTYVVDKSGVIRHTFNSQLQFAKHSKEALDAVKGLA